MCIDTLKDQRPHGQQHEAENQDIPLKDKAVKQNRK